MSRWEQSSNDATAADYAARFDSLAASGQDVHGEAQFCAGRLAPGASVLDSGCGTGRVAIRLLELGYRCVGVDLDRSMLEVARRRAPHGRWVHCDLALLDDASLDPPPRGFDLVLAAGNVVPLVAEGTEAAVLRAMSRRLRHGGELVCGFGLDRSHLPASAAVLTLPHYDAWCADAGLELVDRFATWSGAPYDGGGYAVSVHRAVGPD